MGNLAIKSGTIIYQADTPLTHIACIVKGSITASRHLEQYTLHVGDVIGITDLYRGHINVESTVLRKIYLNQFLQ